MSRIGFLVVGATCRAAFPIARRRRPLGSSFRPFDRLRTGWPAAEPVGSFRLWKASGGVSPTSASRTSFRRMPESSALGFSRPKVAFGRVSPTSAVGESLSLVSPRESNQREGDPGIARQRAPCPALLAGLGPARTRPSMASNIRAFPPSPAALLGAMTGPIDRQPKQEQQQRRHTRSLRAPALRGPCAAAAGGRSGPQGRMQEACAFLPAQGCAVKNPSRPTRTRGFTAGANPGWPFSWLLLFGHSKRSNSAAAEADETLREAVNSRERSEQPWIPARPQAGLS